MRTIKDYFMLALKGAGMGAADVIPGVSGGTIAFMTGIFEELVASINSFNTTAVRLLCKGQIKSLWKHINGSFLLSVGSGILISVLTLAKVMLYLLQNHPIETWAFFFGLIGFASGVPGIGVIGLIAGFVSLMVGFAVKDNKNE